MNVWTIIKLEGCCLKGCDITGKLSEYLFDLKGNKVKNEYYDPTYKENDAPEYCPGKPEFICLENDCEFFGYCEYEGEE